MSDDDDIRALLLRIKKARSHALRISDERTVKSLNELADELESQVAALREKRKPAEAPAIPEQAIDAPQGEPHIGPELIAAMKPPEPDEEQPGPPANES